jgi:hypothetical protein
VFVKVSWKSLPETNTLAYYESLKITDKISLIKLALGFIILVMDVIQKEDKIEHLSLAILSSLIKCLWIKPGE